MSYPVNRQHQSKLQAWIPTVMVPMILFLKTYIYIIILLCKLNHIFVVATTWQLMQLAPCSFSPSSCCCAAALWSSEICCSCWALAASNSTHWAPGRWIQPAAHRMLWNAVDAVWRTKTYENTEISEMICNCLRLFDESLGILLDWDATKGWSIHLSTLYFFTQMVNTLCECKH